ncbi:unnamed protein product [Spirodela intermedia]|uniref:Uncharacterized protein n=1 Tax=Spirodela intermedia TaxID=51605 RepID=A0A7I8K370_SPIIN|nr:unnamed protein product [Spirodela intermedia]
MEATQQEPGIKVLEQCRISPAPGSVAPDSLPLTFFDCIFLFCSPVQRIFFYDLPCSVSDFLANHLPHLKLSLSLALRDFRPLAGSLHPSSGVAKHEIRSSDLDTVPFTVAESGDDFYDISGNHARICNRLHPLVPPLLSGTGTGWPLLALQVTLFPDTGVALGITISHSVADGTTSSNFLKAWAAACRLGMGEVPDGRVGAPPSYDRSVIQDPMDLAGIFLRDLNLLKDDSGMEVLNLHGRNDVVRSTSVISQEQIKKLGEVFSGKTATECSSFALACGFIWACLAKASGVSNGKTEAFGFVFEARGRLDPPLPATYFGNCLGVCLAEADGSDLAGEDGAVIASAAIRKAVQRLNSGGALEGAENWIRSIAPSAFARTLSAAGAPRLGLYQVDFGWGSPRKIEVISIERMSSLSIAEWREDAGGLEIGLALPRDLMGRFTAVVSDALNKSSSPPGGTSV